MAQATRLKGGKRGVGKTRGGDGKKVRAKRSGTRSSGTAEAPRRREAKARRAPAGTPVRKAGARSAGKVGARRTPAGSPRGKAARNRVAVPRARGARKVSGPGAARVARARQVLGGLKQLYPDADCALRHGSALELLVATILSAQSTDTNVNRVMPILFERFPTARDLAAADLQDIEAVIHSTGFFRQKAKSIQGACRRIVEGFGGQVPDSMEALVTLPGVARKTANVVLGTWFGKSEGIVVDTHVGRLAWRLGLTWTSRDTKDAVRIEEDLMQLIPREDWTFFGHAMIWHGRKVCFARRPDCQGCLLSDVCPSAFRVE